MATNRLESLLDIFLLLYDKQQKEELPRDNVLYVHILVDDLKRGQIHVICVKIVMWVFA